MPVFDPTVPLERHGCQRVSARRGADALDGSMGRARRGRQLRADASLRRRRADPRPRQTPVFEAGAGVTPMIGLRFGIAMARTQQLRDAARR